MFIWVSKMNWGKGVCVYSKKKKNEIDDYKNDDIEVICNKKSNLIRLNLSNKI